MAKLVAALLLVVGLMTLTLDQDQTLIWLDSALGIDANEQKPLEIPSATTFADIHPGTAIWKPVTAAKTTRDFGKDTKRTVKIVDGRMVVLSVGGKGTLHYRLPQSDILGGEIAGQAGPKSATVSVQWPRKD